MQEVRKNVILELIEMNGCLYCLSLRVKKNGIRVDKEVYIKKYKCIDCIR